MLSLAVYGLYPGYGNQAVSCPVSIFERDAQPPVPALGFEPRKVEPTVLQTARFEPLAYTGMI